MALGCDTATRVTSRRLRTLQDEKFKFVGRYLNRVEGAHDELTRAEAERICDGGMYVVSIYEDGKANTPSYFSCSQGITDAKEAVALAEDIGQPRGTYIYFTVDCDVTEAQLTSKIVPYFQGVLSILENSDYLLGVYGPERVCQYICGDFTTSKRCAWYVDNSWLAANGTYDTWNMRQYRFNKWIGSEQGKICVDYDESSRYGGGGWQY